MAEKSVSTKSHEAAAMEAAWQKITDILDGQDAVRRAGTRYLPQFGGEDRKAYEYRCNSAKFTNIYRDIVENLAARPFSKKLDLVQTTASAELKEFVEDVDGAGNNLHVFAHSLFFSGVNYGLSFLMCEYSRTPDNVVTLADHKRVGARPYWLLLDCRSVLAARTAMIEGREQFVHFRYHGTYVEEDGEYGEKEVERVHELNRTQRDNGTWEPATFKVHEKQTVDGKPKWVVIDSGSVGIGIIPIVPFYAGWRKAGSLGVSLPMGDAADLQIEHYQAESALKTLKDFCTFPMLCGAGITAPKTDGEHPSLVVGPRSVLFAPPGPDGKHGEWKFIEPTAASAKFLASDIGRIELQLRELGRQPLTAQSGNLTVITTAFAAAKGNSAIQAWALGLKDALEQALRITCMWMREKKSKPEVQINLDLSISHADKSLTDLLAMRKAGDLSQETLWAEARRRDVVGPDFDPEAERKRLREEDPDPDQEENITAAVLPFEPRVSGAA